MRAAFQLVSREHVGAADRASQTRPLHYDVQNVKFGMLLPRNQNHGEMLFYGRRELQLPIQQASWMTWYDKVRS